jgi:hypothetical protein
MYGFGFVKRAALAVAAAGMIIGLSAPSSAAGDATEVWNVYAASYNFDSYPVSANASFEASYNGSDFENDFADIIARVGQVMGNTPPIVGDDVLNASLENWN